MDLSQLSAQELARIDSICLDFERKLRAGKDPSVDRYLESFGGSNPELLKSELLAVAEEIRREASSESSEGATGETVVAPFGTPQPRSRIRRGGPAAAGPQGGSGRGTSSVNGSPIQLPEAGDSVGPYVVGRALGRGGMGAVYEAFDRRLDRTVAMKVLAVGGKRQEELAQRFAREAKAVAALSHPNVVELFDVGENAGLPYAVMELLDGETLEARLRRRPLTIAEVRRLGAQIADALAAAHSAGVIHRDLKPHNIMLVSRHGTVEAEGDEPADSALPEPPTSTSAFDDAVTMAKLFDFGLSRAARGPAQDELSLDASEGSVDSPEHRDRTRSGMIMGTPGYMAPEQARGEEVTAAADIFGLGCILFEGFYGTPAFSGDTPAERLASVLKEIPSGEPSKRSKDPELAELIDRCLQKDPELRPLHAAEIARQLRQPPRLSRFPKQPTLSRRRFGELTCGGILGAAFGGYWLSKAHRPLSNIRSIGVLTLVDETSSPEGWPADGPIKGRGIARGELFSSMVVNELSSISGLIVPKFSPLTASSPEEYRRAGETLEVQALLTGTYQQVTSFGGAQRYVFSLQIVSAKTGKQLWGDTLAVDGGSSLLEQTQLAGKIARAVGHELLPSDERRDRPADETYLCLTKGITYSDPDTVEGLQKALECFEHARELEQENARPNPDSHAGIALTAITLAAQSSDEEAQKHVAEAREAADEALRLSHMSVDARLAHAMIQWQIHFDYDAALSELRELHMKNLNHWQVHHQYGWLLFLLGQRREAIQMLRRAAKLHPTSVTLKADYARARWFAGDADAATQYAKFLHDKYASNAATSGVLVDIYEETGDLAKAAAHQGAFDWKPGDGPDAYFAEREKRLVSLPYGPFGETMNAAIACERRLRAKATIASSGGPDVEPPLWRLNEIDDAQPPMLPLLLTLHPALSTLADLPDAASILPVSRTDAGTGTPA